MIAKGTAFFCIFLFLFSCSKQPSSAPAEQPKNEPSEKVSPVTPTPENTPPQAPQTPSPSQRQAPPSLTPEEESIVRDRHDLFEYLSSGFVPILCENDHCLPFVGTAGKVSSELLHERLTTIPRTLDTLKEYDSFRRHHCTVTLVDQDVILTAKHCLPKEVIEGESIVGRVNVFFPKTKDDEFEAATSVELILTPPKSLTILDGTISRNPIIRPGFDYAYVRISKKLKRKPIEISRRGIKNGDTFTLHRKVNQKWRLMAKNKVNSTSCKANQSTVIGPYFDHPFDPTIILTDCTPAPGNSGGPLVDSNGKLAAIVVGGPNGAVSSALLNKLTRNSIEGGKKIQTPISLVIANNASCIPDHRDKETNVPKQCYSDLESGFHSKLDQLNEQAKEKTLLEFEQWKARDPNQLNIGDHWKLVNFLHFLYAAPTCLPVTILDFESGDRQQVKLEAIYFYQWMNPQLQFSGNARKGKNPTELILEFNPHEVLAPEKSTDLFRVFAGEKFWIGKVNLCAHSTQQ